MKVSPLRTRCETKHKHRKPEHETSAKRPEHVLNQTGVGHDDDDDHGDDDDDDHEDDGDDDDGGHEDVAKE